MKSMRDMIGIVEGLLVEKFIATESPAFQKWFAGSKVVDNNGQPLLCYHGTADDFGEAYYPFTHFGTLQAAKDRLGVWINNNGHNIRPVYLKIINPYMFDDVTGDTADDIIAQLSLKQRKEALGEFDSEWPEKSKEDCILEWLMSQGFDGLVYTNTVEDSGSTSWVVFDHSQVWSAFRQS